MPGPYIHIAVSDEVRSRLADLQSWSVAPSTSNVPPLDGPARGDLAAYAGGHPSYYALGAIGPDLFFFLPDFRALCILGHRIPIANPLIGVLEWIDGLYEAFDSWILEDWERYFGPGSENVEEAISRLTGDLSTVVQDIISKVAAIGTNALLDLVSQSHDWWGLFNLGLNKGYDNQDFFWSDMLHYRKTSQFALALWKQADLLDSDKLRAYALGYMTHVAADTTGHAFVNEKSGGPYRTHWQRHHLVENHMDARTYDDKHGHDSIYNVLTESALHYRIVFTDDGDDYTNPLPPYTPGDNSLRARYVRRRHLDIDSSLPSDLAELIRGAMSAAYDTSTPPTLFNAATSSPRIIPGPDGRPDNEAIETAYLWLFRYLKFSMLDGFNHEKPAPPDVYPNLDFLRLTDPHDDPPSAGSDSLSGLEKFLAVIRFVLWIEAVALWIVTLLPAILLDTATYLPRLAAYYGIQLPLYYILKAERRIMVMTAFLHPTPDEIDIGLVRLCLGHDDAFLAALHCMDDVLGGFGDDLLGTIIAEANQLTSGGSMSLIDAVASILGGFSVTFSEPPPNSNYPHSQPLNTQGDGIEYHAPWRYPSSPTELSPTFAGPYACGDMPHVLLDGAVPGNQSIRAQFENSPAPSATDQISFAAVTPENNLGDPVNFSEYLIWQLTRTDPPQTPGLSTKVTDWNLDADRGYAYKCWDWNRHEPPQPGTSNDFVLRDMENHEYMEPCTPPPQQDVPKAGSFPCAPLAKDRPNPDQPLKLHWADQPDPRCEGKPLLTIGMESRAVSSVTNVSMGVLNSGTAAAINVKVTAITGITASGATVVYAPQLLIIPFLVPGANNLLPGGAAGFNLFFQTTAGSPGTPFSFDITAKADNAPSFTTTIHVP